MAGNSYLTCYTDNQGSIGRRLAIFNFKKTVKAEDIDSELDNKLKEEIPNILFKCNRAYLEAIKQYKGQGFWKICPKYFADATKEMNKQTNALVHFLDSNEIVYNKKLYCLKSDFVRSFNNYAKINNFTKSRFTKNYYEGPFEEKGIKLVREIKQIPGEPDESKMAEWLIGINLADFILNETNSMDHSY